MNDELMWQEWREHYANIGVEPDQICLDGIIDEKAYASANRKVLFVMKEVNDWDGGDLRAMLHDGPKFQMWHTVARWAAGILRDFPSFEEIDTFEIWRESIRSIATINLKKASGGASADMSLINAYAKMDRELLLKQIQMISPDIIVAGGTFDPLIWLLDLKVDPGHPQSRAVFDQHRKIQVIPWRHPARVDNRKTYDNLREIVQKP